MFFRRSVAKRLKIIALIIGVLFPFIGLSQNNIPTGSWRTHYSYNSTISISQSETNTYAASKAGVYIVDKMDKSISSLTKLNGLSETNIALINYNETTASLLISYDNGQIDILSESGIISIPDIKLSEIFRSKLSHHMNPVGIYSYLSTDFGLVQIDTHTKQIKESYLNLSSTGDNLIVNASILYNDSLFLATEDGIIGGSLFENLKDFSKWKRFSPPGEKKVIGLYEGKPITGDTSLGLLIYENGSWSILGEMIGESFSSIETNNNKTIITSSGNVYELQNRKPILISSSDFTYSNMAIPDKESYWMADNQNGLVLVDGDKSESIYPSGPFFNDITNLKTVDNKVYALPEFKTKAGNPAKNNGGFSVFENGVWSNYNSTGLANTFQIPAFLDISGVSSLSTGGVIFSSFGYGLLHWDEANFEIIDETNSVLVNSSPPDRNVLIRDIDTDNTNLWALNNNTDSSLHVLEPNQSWSTFMPSRNISNASKIVSTPWGDLWITVDATSGGGIVVYNSTDVGITLKSAGTGTIPSNTVNQIIKDKEDKMWIATAKGVVYYLYPYSIIDDSEQEAIIPIIDSRLLFNNTNVNCLAVDGGNRIWMGTDEGAWLFDNDGSELIEHFTTENSPLLSDRVLNIVINDKSGELFFNTDKGLISFRGSGTITGTYTKPKIFPNPVTPTYSGVITIEGVPTITDASGRLIANLEANGNTATWDFKNAYNRQVITGVYFVFISSKDGSQTQIGKIAIVK